MIIAVYCSSKDTIPEEYLQLGDELGKWIAQSGNTMLYGGATGGLMSRTSNAAKNNGGKVIGVVPERIIASGRKAENCDELYVVKNMNERKQKMKEIADCFICLPGGCGTLDEMYDVIASGTVGEHKKPIYIISYKGFYDHLIGEHELMRQQSFIPQQERYKPTFVKNTEELFTLLKYQL